MLALTATMLATTLVPNAFAHTQNYLKGFYDGGNAYRNGENYYGCPTDQPHTPNYCAGYTDGWHKAQNYETNIKQQQSSNINVKGNNNRITVNQGQSGISNSDGSNSYHYYGHSGSNGRISQPRCNFLCFGASIN